MSSPSIGRILGIREVEEARAAISGTILETPCLRSMAFSEALGVEAFFKYEGLQLTGSFKARGAFFRIRRLSPAEAAAGVITSSAGNHAQGVALSARLAGIAATIVMPRNTPLIKVASTRRLGGRVVLAGNEFDEANAEAMSRARRDHLTFIPPFDDERVIAGQGTVGLEILERVPEVDAVVVPVGGGGLISGIATALKGRKPSVRVYGVQTEAAPAMAESFATGTRVVRPARRTVAEGIAVKSPGELTFEIIRRLVDGIVVVSEDEIISAIVELVESGKTVAEGAAAAALAAVRGHHLPELEGRTVVMVLSGANIDPQMLARILDRSLVERRRLVRFRTHVDDRPGALAELLHRIGAGGGNVVRIQHDRLFKHAGFWEAEVEITLETRDEEHIQELQQALTGAGYRVERLD